MWKSLILCLLIQSMNSKLSNIVLDTPYCKPTNMSIDLNGECLDKNCAMFKNFLGIFSGIEDEFHYIYNSDNVKTVVYSNHGRVYYTECTFVNAFDIVENTTKCTIDTLVTFQFQYHETPGYYTRNSIIRESLNYKKFCECSSTIINVGNINSDFSIYKLDHLVTVTRRNDSLADLDFEKQNQIVEVYDRKFGNSNVFILIETLVLIIIFLMMFLKFLFEKKRKLLAQVKFLNVCCKKICIKRQILPTTNCHLPVYKPTPSAPYLPAQFPSQVLPSAVSVPPFAMYDPNLYHTIGNNHYLTRSQSVVIMNNDSAENLPFRCEQYKADGKKCERSFGTLQGLGTHMARSHKSNK